MNAVLFIATTLIWGMTWSAIVFEAGPVPVVVSVFYRFALAAIGFLAILALTGRLRTVARRDQVFVLGQGLCMFSLNFLCMYGAIQFIPSGLASVVFSLATLFNAVNARIFFGDRITGRTVVAALIGACGLALVFGGSLHMGGLGRTLIGVGLMAMGTLLFSLGNMASRRNTLAGVPPWIANAWGMACGAAVLFVIACATGAHFVAPPNAAYIWALGYLAVFGSIIGFTTYLLMVVRIGSSRAAYVTVLSPIVALTISTFLEGFHWTWLAGCGVALTLLGNVVIFTAPKPLASARA